MINKKGKILVYLRQSRAEINGHPNIIDVNH